MDKTVIDHGDILIDKIIEALHSSDPA
ncbi:uncharacterized protein METZ01_LOCUS289946 [marine metagenome]|uniref:Uncharacterized protein n=1 Tax=marine metagenome TaxID=408172 RepID=A0A382LPR7_9ZZZZ